MEPQCEICGTNRGLDQHHVIPRGMGGSEDQAVTDKANLTTLCRLCHQKVHEGHWALDHSTEFIRVFDKRTGEQVMRRLRNPDLDVPFLFQQLNATEALVTSLLQALPYLTDEQMVEAFSYANSFGKRSWLLQAAILYEAQKRSIYGEKTLEAIARRFEISLRQAQKYALVWKVFFDEREAENVNIDAILLDEPSWYVVAATETKEPEKWLGYAQDRKIEDSRYSVAAFRRDILISRFNEGVGDFKVFGESQTELPPIGRSPCPWVKPLCVRSGKPLAPIDCTVCEFNHAGYSEQDQNEMEDLPCLNT